MCFKIHSLKHCFFSHNMPYHNGIAGGRMSRKVDKIRRKKLGILENNDRHFPTMMLQIVEVLSFHFLRIDTSYL